MHGFHGRMLRIDCGAREFHIETLPEELLLVGLGGKGLGSALLLRMNPPGCDPLGPENHIIFATGPVTQSLVWGSSRYGVYSKSPLTGGYLESYTGGRVPEAMDAAGFDAVVLHGRAEKPLCLVVHPWGCDFVDASDLWGQDTYDTEDAAVALATERFPEFTRRGAVVIGPAAESLVRFAVIENDYWRSAGRGGAGAVLGAKRIKALAFTGDCRREVADPQGLKEHSREFMRRGRDLPGVKAYKAQGTTLMVALMNNVGAFPARYWSQGTCDHWEKLSGDTFHATHRITPHACAKCFMACGRMATMAQGRHQGLTIEGPEYETIYAFGGLCMIEDMAEIAWLNDICDRLGMDTISAGNLCALAMEAAARGVIDRPLPYGDADAVAELLRDIAARRGLGDLLAQGIRAAAQELGLEDMAVHVKGMEPPGYDPRVLKGMGLTYAIADRGACHLRTTFYKPELAGMIPPDAIVGKAELLVDFEDRLTVFDTLILCRFFRDLYTWEELATVVHLVTGRNMDTAALRRLASTVRDTTRRFNLREGLGAEQDALPKRLLTEALPSGHVLHPEELATLLADYYRLRGWDEMGLPPQNPETATPQGTD